MWDSDADRRSKILDVLEVLDTLEATSSGAIIVSNANDGTILRWNPPAEHLLGYRASEVIGRPVFMLEPRDHQGEIQTNLTLVQHGVAVGPLRTERLRKDGTPVTVTAQSVPVRNEDGEVAWAVTLLRAEPVQAVGSAPP